MALRTNTAALSGNLNGVVAGTTVFANSGSIQVGDGARQKVKALSAQVTATAATATLTIAVKWQVSADKVTWIDASNGPQNAASVPFTTGTSAARTGVFSAPDAVYSSNFARAVLVTGVVAGAAGDTYTIGYSYRTPA